MARQEQDREDLLAEGVHLVRRGRLCVDEVQWVAGWRANLAWSVYENADPVFQFNESGHLRRVYCDGIRYAAVNGELCELVRVPMPTGKLRLSRVPIDAARLDHLVTRWRGLATRFEEGLCASGCQIETVGIDKQEWKAETKQVLSALKVQWIVAQAPEAASPRW